MKRTTERRLTLTLILLILLAFAPTATRAQDTQPTDQPATPSLTRPTAMPWPPAADTSAPASSATTAPAAPNVPANAATTLVPPALAMPVYGLQGVLVETLEGGMVAEQSADQTFNPASAVKLATALTALHNFGADHRFDTAVWSTGTFDAATGTINGDLVVSGRDPSFHYEHAVMLASELNRQGIRVVTGDLIVAPRFTMNFDWSAQRSGDKLYDALDSTRRNAAAVRAWNDDRFAARDTESLRTVPSVAVMGAVYVDTVPENAHVLLTHRSSKLVDVLKVLLCYSNNFMAERIGDNLGGAQGVRRYLVQDVGIPPSEVSLASTSGLGVNRVTPRAMMKIFRALRDELAKSNLTPADILPVAGIDPGTLQRRYNDSPARGSVIAKTGTLTHTDGGASALVGEMLTKNGDTLLFVIFNQRGSVWRFRTNQDFLVSQIQSTRGGPAPFIYRPITLAMRLADTEQGTPAGKDEYEPEPK